MATKLYFHDATSTLANLPTTEQSVLLPVASVDAQTVNRTMNTTIGVGPQVQKRAVTQAITAQRAYYFTRFVSDAINQTSIAANTWTFNFAIRESNANANFPVTTSGSANVCCYVWRPGTGKVGDILNSATGTETIDEATTGITVRHTTFSGSAVASTQLGDVIVMEIIFQTTQGNATSRNDDFFYDGSTENTTVGATVTDHASFLETPETITFSAGTNYTRSPSTETVDVSDSSLTRILSAARAPSADSSSIGETLTRTTQAFRSPSSDSVTTAEDLTRSKTWVRATAADDITIADSSTTQIITRVRAPDAETVVVGENASRMTQASRSPSSDTIIVDESLSGGKLLEREPSTENVTVADSSLTRMLSVSRQPSEADVTVGENPTRILSAMRSPSSDSTTISDISTTQMITRVRAPTVDEVTIIDSSLTRMLSATRALGSDSITVVDSSLTRIYSALRIPSTESVTTSEDVSRIVSNPGQFNRSPATENVTVGENLTRALQLFRVPSSDSVTVSENVSGGKLLERVVAADTVNIVEASLTRMKSAARNVEDTSNIVEASLTRLLFAFRVPNADTVTVAELQSLISHSRSLLDTISVTEPLLQRIVTSVRSLGPETVDIAEQVFFQTWHRFVFDSVVVAEQLFGERQSLSGPITYATPSEVRPLLGNIGSQRTDPQIQLAIDSAYDEINKKTSRIPPNDWKDTDADFSIIKKITRMKAALEMSIGIKDFEDREWMQKEIDEMFMMLEEHDVGGALSNDVVISSDDETYALNPQGIIWSTRYKNLKKSSGIENDTTINPDT